jgi:hypothetical protein
VLLEQSQSLQSTCNTTLVDDLKRDYRSFKSSVHSELSLSEQLDKHGPMTSFDDAWRPLGMIFSLLKQLCGGLAFVFPGTATVESDFGVLKWEFNEHRSSLTDFSLEGIMQCKQFKKLSSLHHCSPSTSK